MIRKLLRLLCPPILPLIWRKINRPKANVSFKGKYRTWEEAAYLTTGYDEGSVIEDKANGMEKVIRGEAAFERDGTLFEELEFSWPVLACLRDFAKKGEKLEVIDFGGSFGSSFHQYKSLLNNDLHWNIIEQPNIVKIGKERFENKQLSFDTGLTEKHQQKNVFFSSSTLQYIPDITQLVEQINSYEFEHLLFDRIGLSNNPGFVTTQHNLIPRPSSYPARFFSTQEFTALFSSNYRLIHTFDCYCDPELKIETTTLFWKGFYFKRK